MKHIVIDARIRRASTGRPVDRFLQYLAKYDTTNRYTLLVEPTDDIKFQSANITTVPCSYKQYSLNPLQQITYARQLKSLKPDLVFFTMTGQAPLGYKGPNVTFTHDLTMLRYARAGKYPEILHKIRMVAYRKLFDEGNLRAHKIITPSQFVKEDLISRLPEVANKTTVIYESSEPIIKQKATPVTGVNKPFILHVGSPFPHKNIHRLVEAFIKLKDNYPNLQLVLGGKKEFYFNQLIDWLKDKPYKDDIIIPGFVSDTELKWLYQNAECYVLPSLSEGFGLPGLEAMAHNCPLASSKATCMPEIYGNAAKYFDPNDSDSIKNTVNKILSDKKLKETLVKNGQKQLKKYSWAKMTEEIVKIIRHELLK